MPVFVMFDVFVLFNIPHVLSGVKKLVFPIDVDAYDIDVVKPEDRSNRRQLVHAGAE